MKKGSDTSDSDTKLLVNSLSSFEISEFAPKSVNENTNANISADSKRKLVIDSSGKVSVSDFNYSKDGKLILACCAQNILLFDALAIRNSKSEKPTIITDGTTVHSASFSSNGDYFVSCGKNVKYWNTKTRLAEKQLSISNQNPSSTTEEEFTSIRFSPVSNNLAAVSSNLGFIYIWNIDANKVLKTLSLEKRNHIYDVSFSSDGKKLVSCDNGKGLKLWDIEKGAIIASFKHSAEVRSCDYHSSLDLIVSCCDKYTYLWAPSSPSSPVRSLVAKPIQTNVSKVKFSPTDDLVACISADGRFVLWDWKYEKIILEEKDTCHNSATGYGLDLSEDGKEIVYASMIDKKLGPCISTITDFKQKGILKKATKNLNTGGGQTIVVNLLKGIDLAAADYNGKSDPYCVFYIVRKDESTFVHNGQNFKSKVVSKSLNPTWNERFEYSLKGIDFENTIGVRFEVFDRDLFSKNEPIGQATIPWDILTMNLESGQREYPLYNRPNFEKMERFGGTLLLAFSIKQT